MTSSLRIAVRPLYLAVLLVAIATGLTIDWRLLPLGLIVYVVSVALAARDPQTARSLQRSVARGKITSPTFRAVIDEIDRVQAEINRSVAQSSAPLNRLLHGISTQTDDLVAQAHNLAEKGQTIERFLQTVNRRQVQDQISQLDVQIPRVTDQYTLQQLQETRAALIDRRANAEALDTYSGRINAQLQNICANLNNVLAETVRLRTADAVSADSTSNEVAERLRDLNADMDAFQRTLDTALVQTGASA